MKNSDWLHPNQSNLDTSILESMMLLNSPFLLLKVFCGVYNFLPSGLYGKPYMTRQYFLLLRNTDDFSETMTHVTWCAFQDD